MDEYDVLASSMLIHGVASNEDGREIRLPALTLLEPCQRFVCILQQLGDARLVAVRGGQRSINTRCEARRTRWLRLDRSCSHQLLRRQPGPRTSPSSCRQVRRISEPCTPDAALR